MSNWKVDVGGRERTVSMESPMLGRKVIYVDGQELKKVGTPISMWANYKFDVDGTPALIKFRAMRRMKGMSLYVNDEFVEPQPGGHMSAETVQWFMLGAVVILVIALAFAFTKGG